ncbi:hypothetical protein Tco_1310436 [Tanacetum coccineum]
MLGLKDQKRLLTHALGTWSKEIPTKIWKISILLNVKGGFKNSMCALNKQSRELLQITRDFSRMQTINHAQTKPTLTHAHTCFLELIKPEKRLNHNTTETQRLYVRGQNQGNGNKISTLYAQSQDSPPPNGGESQLRTQSVMTWGETGTLEGEKSSDVENTRLDHKSLRSNRWGGVYGCKSFGYISWIWIMPIAYSALTLQQHYGVSERREQNPSRYGLIYDESKTSLP